MDPIPSSPNEIGGTLLSSSFDSYSMMKTPIDNGSKHIQQSSYIPVIERTMSSSSNVYGRKSSLVSMGYDQWVSAYSSFTFTDD